MITLQNGFPQGPNGLIVPLGSIKLQLNVDATIIAAPGGFVAADIPVVFQFDKNGALIQPAKIWSNEELQPQLSSTLLGTYYLVTFMDQNGAVLNATPLWWQFPEIINSTVDISQMTPVSTVGGNVIFYPTSFGGSGTVTSITFTGDGTVLSATPSAPVTTSGTIAATLLTQNALTFLAGPTTPGPAAAPTFRTITTADVPPLLWNSLIAATADLTLANTTFNTTFTQTASTVTWAWKNVNPATAIVNRNSPILALAGQVWSGSATEDNTWVIQNQIAPGVAGSGQTLNISQLQGFTNSVVNIAASVTCGSLTPITITGNVPIVLSRGSATAIMNLSSPIITIDGSWWDGAAAHVSSTTIQEVTGAGTNASDQLVISNSGAFAWAGVSIVGPLTAQTLNITAAAASTTAGQLQIGNAIATLTGASGSAVTTNSTASPGPASTTAIAGYIKMFIGTQAIWVAYWE